MSVRSMIPRLHALSPAHHLVPSSSSIIVPSACRRHLHSSLPRPPIPAPTPFVPDAATFLTLIGRQLSAHSSKITSWDRLFSLTSAQLRELGVEPARTRRYLLNWRRKFRAGEYGIGGDLAEVVDGVGEVRIAHGPRGKKVAVNVGADADGRATRVKGVKVQGPGRGKVAGSHFQPVKGSGGTVARIKVSEGLWEIKRGRKIHGGERRRKNVLSRIAARARGTLK